MFFVVAHVPQQDLSIGAQRKKILSKMKLYVDGIIAAGNAILPPDQFTDDFSM